MGDLTSRRGRRRPRPGGGGASALLLTGLLASAVDPVRGGGNFCGRSWVDVMTSCQRACPSGEQQVGAEERAGKASRFGLADQMSAAAVWEE